MIVKYLGLFNGLPLYEIVRGAYVIVDPEEKKILLSGNWFGHLDRYGETFTKGGENKDDDKCIEIMRKNKDEILGLARAANERVEENEADGLFDGQDEFYNWLEERREYNCYAGKYSDEQ